MLDRRDDTGHHPAPPQKRTATELTVEFQQVFGAATKD